MVPREGFEPPKSQTSGLQPGATRRRRRLGMECVEGLEPSPTAWKADVLAVEHYTHMIGDPPGRTRFAQGTISNRPLSRSGLSSTTGVAISPGETLVQVLERIQRLELCYSEWQSDPSPSRAYPHGRCSPIHHPPMRGALSQHGGDQTSAVAIKTATRQKLPCGLQGVLPFVPPERFELPT